MKGQTIPDACVSDVDQPFFIVGTGRCGSTLLQVMLSCHKRLRIPPETRFFGRMDPSVHFSDPLSDEHVAKYAKECRDDLWWRQIGVPVSELADNIENGMRSSRDVFLWVLRRLTSEIGVRIGEKTPQNGLHIERILQLFPNAKFIHIYRDPRDVVGSYLQQYWCTDQTGINVALYCRHCLRTIAQHGERYGPKTITSVQYEKLVQNPEPELRRLCRFLDEEFDEAMLSFDRRETAGFSTIEEPWKGLTRKPLTESRIGRFRKSLTRSQLLLVEQTMGATLVNLGYEPALEGRWRPDWQLNYICRRLHRRVMRWMGLVKPLLDEDKVRKWFEQHADPTNSQFSNSLETKEKHEP